MKRVLSCLYLLAFSACAFAAPFQNGGFELGTPTADPCNISLPVGSTAITGWTVIVGDIDYVVGCWTSSEGARSLDLVGTGTKGGIQQTFDTVPGQAYEVIFDFAGNPASGFYGVKKLNAFVDDGVSQIFMQAFTFDTTYYTPAFPGWLPHSFQFVATTTSSTLGFISDMTPSTFAGAAVDNVRVRAIPAGAWSPSDGTVIGGIAAGYPPSSPLVCASSQWSFSGETFFYRTMIDSFGVQGPMVASYAVPQGNTVSGICGTWTATTVAAASGPVALNWDYSFNHNSFEVTGDLQAVVVRGGSPLPPVLLATYRGPPGGPFEFSGQYTFNVLAGDVYGFTMTGSNYDSTDSVIGTLYVTGTGASTVALATSGTPSPSGTPVTFTATVTGSNPRGTVGFSDGAGEALGCAAAPLLPVNATQSTATCTAPLAAVGLHTITAQYSGDMVNARSLNTLGQTVGPGTALAPVLIRAQPSGSALPPLLIGRMDTAISTPVTVRLYGGTSCVGGVLGGATQIVPDAGTNTDPNGYFGTSQGGAQAQFVAISLTTPVATAMSNCVVTSADNDTWPKALRLTGGNTTVSDWIDAPGKARWYRFGVIPGQNVQITLAGLPADYDLAVFKDIGAAFLSDIAPPATTDQLTKLSSQYAPSAFSPSAFSPSAFSPSAFSPSAFSPSAFSPSAFSPSAFSPSAFSPSAFSPSAFSPSAFSPSAFSPSAFSPSAFSPSAFSPSAFSPSAFSPIELNEAFSSAQTRSIIAASMTPGLGNESVVVNTWNNTGDFYIRVTGRSGASSPAPFNLAVAAQGVSCVGVAALPVVTRSLASTGYTTAVVIDSSKTPLSSVLVTGGTLQAKLTAFVQRADVNGVIVDVDADARVRALKSQASANLGCPYAKNLVALEIKSIVDTYLKRTTTPRLSYIVLVGSDDAIPFFRYPDESLLGQESGYVPPVSSSSASEASLRRDYVLSQDAYGAKTQISLRVSDFPIPGLAVGRLIETPDEIAGMIDAYVAANGVVSPASSLVTGYDFLQDAADAVKTELGLGTGQNPDTLITPANVSPADTRTYAAGGPWTASDLRQKLTSRHDVMFLAGHFNANSALAADFKTSMITSELALSANLTNALVFSAGCHAGYNLVDSDAINGVTFPLDWAQAFAQRKATLVAGTGYQYGDTDFIEYSERLYLNFAKQLRAGRGKVAIGDALVKAKLAYLAATPDIRGLHTKALLEATLFGLPMLGVNMPAGRSDPATNAGVIDTAPPLVPGPATTLGLQLADISVAPVLTSQSRTLTNYEVQPPTTTVATFYSGPNGVVTQPAEPTLPLQVVDVTPKIASLVLRGVGFVGGTYTDSTVLPLTGAPTTELRGVHTPFSSPLFFPMRVWTTNYFNTLSGAGGTSLLVTPVQHRALDATNSTLRRYSGLDVRLYYTDLTSTTNPDNAAAVLSDAPTIVSVDAMPIGTMATFVAQVVGNPAAAMHEVWVTYTDGAGGNGAWTSKYMQQCVAPVPAACGSIVDSQYWVAQVPLAQLPADTKFVVQAVNGVGLVSLDDNLGRYYSLGGAALPAATTIAFVPPVPVSANSGDVLSIGATLSAGPSALAGKLVTIGLGGAARTAITGPTGGVMVQVPVLSAPGTYPLTASFAGDAAYQPSATSAPAAVTVGKASTKLSPPASGVGVVLTGSAAPNARPLALESIQFLVSGPQGVQQVFATTDYTGRATIPPPGYPAGTYSVIQACFAGNSTYAATQLNASPACGYRFAGFFQPVDNLPIVNVLKAGQAVPVKFSLGGNRGLAIFANGSPGSQQVTCGTNVGTSDVDQISTAGASGLQYDAGSDQYTYVWKTDKAWGSSCRMLVLTLNDGTQYRATFQFK